MPSDAPTRRDEQPGTAHSDASPSYRTGVIFAVLALGAMAYTLLQSMVLPALPVLQRDLHTSQSVVTWVLTAYLLSASIATPIIGRLGDMFGKKLMLLVVFAALSVGSLLAGVADSVGLLIVARVIQGMAGAVFPLAFGIIRDEFPAKKVAGSIGLMSTMTGIGAGLGTVIAGPVVDNLSWHWLFWIPLVISVLAGIATVVVVPESPVRAPGKVNVPAALLLSGWLVCLLLGLSRGSSWGWSAPGTLGLFVGAVALFALWMRLENASDVPLVDLRMMRVPTVWWSNVAALLLGFGLYASIVVIPPFLQTPKSVGYGFGASVTASGLFMLPSTLGMICVGLFIGRITHRFGAKPMLVGGSVLSGAPFLVLAFAHSSPVLFVLAVTAQGFGIGLAFSSMSNLVMNAVPASQTGIATGMNANIRTIGGSIGSQVVATVVTAGASVSGVPSESGYTMGLAILAIAMIAAGFTALGVPRRVRPREPEQALGVPLARSEAATLPVRI